MAMRSFLIHWVVTAIALAVGARVVPGIHVSGLAVLLVAALVLGLVNAVIRPVLLVLTLPITILTLGLFYLVVNGIAFGLAAALVPGFTVASLGSAVCGALVVGLVSWALGWALRPRPPPLDRAARVQVHCPSSRKRPRLRRSRPGRQAGPMAKPTRGPQRSIVSPM